jgi:hypothetical protein
MAAPAAEPGTASQPPQPTAAIEVAAPRVVDSAAPPPEHVDAVAHHAPEPPAPRPTPVPTVIEAAPIAVPELRAVSALPPVALELPPDSGLVLVETTHRAQSESADEPPPGPRRARRARAVLIDEPLQLVETRKESPPAN